MKIICIGENYPEHNKELNTTNPGEPVVFIKPDTAVLKNNKPFYIPDFTNELHYETELIVKINRLGKNIAAKFASRYYNEIGLGVDFTARDLQRKLRAEGKPWEICKAFDNAAVIGNFLPISYFKNLQDISFHLNINEKTVQRGNSKDMIFSIDELIAYVSRFFTLKIGDILFTGTPAGVGKVSVGDHLEGYIFEEKMFDFFVK
ncbi:MAG TPA: fumarylacetoacetate hydrolase family protein [Paludibacteraceae bacterium]|nr:fumarylacetoacetate hydrolase family protein [Paludibacteraceae bacterium]HOL00135.1 fumarylacetoacetate hydrolase family protein [Paludibacteraceae bacterium]HPC26368.1 fumarylacetoacetate hydrolase family protein [Paludibacteraceae bacterium]HPO67026.1 fumarylacetoacetate hydrolase family protein [Paludibacteraceae bacterium]HRU63451.1 fumarylacetoacetate hydrolase family protein [Paludibacteraceae bacterium]